MRAACNRFATLPDQGIEIIGRVERLEDFYRSVDLVINPMMFGTGLKIKTVEALSFGHSIISTWAGMSGILEATHPYHACESIEDLLQAIDLIMRQPTALSELRQASRKLFADYYADTMAQLQKIFPRVDQGAGVSQFEREGLTVEAHEFGHRGWYTTESDHEGQVFRWIGPDPVAEITVKVPRHAPVACTLAVINTIQSDIFKSLQIQIDGMPADIDMDTPDNRVAAGLLVCDAAEAGDPNVKTNSPLRCAKPLPRWQSIHPQWICAALGLPCAISFSNRHEGMNMNRPKAIRTPKSKRSVIRGEAASDRAAIFQETSFQDTSDDAPIFQEQISTAVAGAVAPQTNGESRPVVAPHEVVLDVVTAYRIAGWAWNPGQPDEKLAFNIFFGDTEVATVRADRYREDLKVANKGDGHHAFEWAPDPSLLPDGGCLVSLRQLDTNALLGTPKPLILQPGKPPSRAAKGLTEVVGYIDQAEPYRISGWAFNPNRPIEPLVVELLFNGTSLAKLRCDEYRKDLKEAGFGDGRHSFAWVPDPSLLQPGSYTIELRDIGSGGKLLATRSMFYRPAMLIDGAVALRANGDLEGWAWNKFRPNDALSVGLFDGENLLVTAVADKYDPKLAAEGVGSGAHGFALRPPAFYDGEPRMLSVKALPSCVELAGSPVLIPLHVGRQLSLHPSMNNLDPEQTSRTLIEAVTNLSRCVMPPARVDVDAYKRSCLDALVFLYSAEKSAGSAEIVFPEFSDPQVSIIIPVYNQFEYTWRCLKSVAVATMGLSFEVIVMDDCSSDETSSLPKRVSGLRYIRQEKNKNFLLNCSQGAEAARGKYLYFLNNDTELTPGAIQALLQTFVDFPDAGAVGSKLIYSGWEPARGWFRDLGQRRVSSHRPPGARRTLAAIQILA